MAVSVLSFTNESGSSPIAIPAHGAGILLLLLDRANSATAPTTPAGWTSLAAATNGVDRSLRLSKRLSDGTPTSVAYSAQAQLWLFDGASDARVDIDGSGAIQTTHDIPTLTGCDTSGRSMLVAGMYSMNNLSGTSGSWTLQDNDYVYIAGNTSSTSPSGTMTSSTSIYEIAFLAEIIGLGASVQLAAETDTALALGMQLALATALAAETDSGLALTGTLQQTITTALETDTALQLAFTPQLVMASETDIGLQLPALVRYSITLAASSETALPLAQLQTQAVSLAVETDTPYTLGLAITYNAEPTEDFTCSYKASDLTCSYQPTELTARYRQGQAVFTLEF